MKYAFGLTCAVIIAASIGGMLWFSTPPAHDGAVGGVALRAEARLRSGGEDATSGEAPAPAAPVEETEPTRKPDLPNFHQVTADLYRGGQPTEKGVWQLKEMGIRTIVNLRSFHSDRGMIGRTGLDYDHIYMKAWHPEEKEVVHFLKIVTDKKRTPVFVHCQHGADRTGTMVAIYRIAVCGWDKEKALKEMTEGPFGFHGIWRNLVTYVDKLDMDEIKREVGIAETADTLR